LSLADARDSFPLVAAGDAWVDPSAGLHPPPPAERQR
jgi:hypothetical protein